MAFTEEELKDRVNFIGASEAAAAVGLSKYKTVLGLWAEKTGNVEPEDISLKTQVRVGTKGEQLVAEMFTEDTGKKVHKVSEAYIHKKYNFIRTHIDRKVDGENASLECKVVSAYREREFDNDEIPADMLLQCVHNIACTNYDRVYLAVLIGNHRFEIRTIERDLKLEDNLIKKEVAFWNDFVVPKIMPITITKDDGDVLYKLYPEAQEREISLDDEAKRLIELKQAYDADIKNLTGLLEATKNQLKALLKDADTGTVENFIVTWKESVTKRIDTELFKRREPEMYQKYLKETSGRTLGITNKKEDK